MKNKGLTKLEKAIIRTYNARLGHINDGVLARARPYDEALKLTKAKLATGEITSTEYRRFLQRQLFSSAWSSEVSSFVNGEMITLNRIANSLINKERESAFIYGYNTGLWDIEKSLSIGTTFSILDEHTMARLVAGNPTLLPKAREYAWGSRRVHSALVTSMIQGESVPKIAKRLTEAVNMDKVSAVRNARTMVTACENAGRMEMAQEAEARGINLKKTWLATLDERTRESHAEMDGVSVGVDEPFILTNPDGTTSELMYPADPNGDPAQVYNCRCTLIYNVDNKYDDIDPAIVERRGKIANYDNWKNRHR